MWKRGVNSANRSTRSTAQTARRRRKKNTQEGINKVKLSGFGWGNQTNGKKIILKSPPGRENKITWSNIGNIKPSLTKKKTGCYSHLITLSICLKCGFSNLLWYVQCLGIIITYCAKAIHHLCYLRRLVFDPPTCKTTKVPPGHQHKKSRL